VRVWADKSAVGAVNRLLHLSFRVASGIEYGDNLDLSQ